MPDQQFEVEIQNAEDRYSRQASLGLNRAQSVIIVGCGGVGSWLAYLLAKAGVTRLLIFDSDKVELSNLHRLPLEGDSIGRCKSEAVRDLCRRANPEGLYEALSNYNPLLHTSAFFSEANAAGDDSHDAPYFTWVACSTDSLKSRRLARELAREMHIGYLECGAEGTRGSVTNEPPEFSTSKEDSPGYEITPAFVGPCAMAAAMAAYHILYCVRPAGTYIADWTDDEFEQPQLVFRHEGV